MTRAALTLTLALMLAGCGGRQLAEILRPQQDPFAEQREAAIARAFRTDPVTGERTFVGHSEYVILSDFEFSPNELVLRAGELVRIRLSNVALVTHYFGGDRLLTEGAEVVNVPGSEVPPGQDHIPVNPLTERDIYLFVRKPGDYVLDCFVPAHRLEGMVGRIRVEPAA